MRISEITHFEALYPPESRFREAEIALGYVKRGQSCQIIGLPGVGQSTFLKLLSYNRNVRIKHLGEKEQKRYHFVLINLLEVRKKPLIEITKLILLSLIDSFRERGLGDEYENLLRVYKDSAMLGDELLMFQGLKQALDFLILDRDFSLILLLDRFEEYIPFLTDDFFANLRMLKARGGHKFSVILTLSRPLEESVEPSLVTDFAEYIKENHVYLSLKDDSILNFRINQLEELSGETLSTEVKEQVLEATGGFGRLLKNCVQVLLKNEDLPKANGLAAFLLNHPQVQTVLYDIWEALTPSEQDFLLAGNYQISDMDYPYLQKVGLLKDSSITIPLFEMYMNNSLKERDRKDELSPIIFNSQSNEIRKGEDVISDRLTSLEYRLLRYLLNQKGVVVDREMIISSVWSDAASTAGVTDQALDQLIFRLRKKVEDDPYSPKHIQTVKGRGIKFTP